MWESEEYYDEEFFFYSRGWKQKQNFSSKNLHKIFFPDSYRELWNKVATWGIKPARIIHGFDIFRVWWATVGRGSKSLKYFSKKCFFKVLFLRVNTCVWVRSIVNRVKKYFFWHKNFFSASLIEKKIFFWHKNCRQ